LKKRKSDKNGSKKSKPPPLTAFFKIKDPLTSKQETPVKSREIAKKSGRKNSQSLPRLKTSKRVKYESIPLNRDLFPSISEMEDESTRSLLYDSKTNTSTNANLRDKVTLAETIAEEDTLFLENKIKPVIYLASYNFLQNNYERVFTKETETWLINSTNTIPGHLNSELIARVTDLLKVKAPEELLESITNGAPREEFEKEFYSLLGEYYTRNPSVFLDIVDIALSGEGRVILVCQEPPNRPCACQVLADFLDDMSSYVLGKKLIIRKLG
jgi:hypothetical protein